MKRKWIIAILFAFIIVVSFTVFQPWKGNRHREILSDLEGTIFFTERVDDVLTLFKADANLQNKTLIYSHKGKGKDSYGGYNDNIIDFYYDKSNNTIFFIAMNNGSWSLFSIAEGEEKPNLLKTDTMEINTDYINGQINNLTVTSERGSIYLIENGNEKVLKKFYGIYDEKFTGYEPIGFSPDGKYLVYFSMDHITPFGTLIEGLITDSVGNTYIMDLSTMESTRYIEAWQIQWLMD